MSEVRTVNEKANELKEFELSGNVQLDEASMEKIYNKVRRGVVAELRETGCSFQEAKGFLQLCTWEEYVGLIRVTIDDVVKQAEADNARWTDIVRKKNLLKSIQSLCAMVD